MASLDLLSLLRSPLVKDLIVEALRDGQATQEPVCSLRDLKLAIREVVHEELVALGFSIPTRASSPDLRHPSSSSTPPYCQVQSSVCVLPKTPIPSIKLPQPTRLKASVFPVKGQSPPLTPQETRKITRETSLSHVQVGATAKKNFMESCVHPMSIVQNAFMVEDLTDLLRKVSSRKLPVIHGIKCGILERERAKSSLAKRNGNTLGKLIVRITKMFPSLLATHNITLRPGQLRFLGYIIERQCATVRSSLNSLQIYCQQVDAVQTILRCTISEGNAHLAYRLFARISKPHQAPLSSATQLGVKLLEGPLAEEYPTQSAADVKAHDVMQIVDEPSEPVHVDEEMDLADENMDKIEESQPQVIEVEEDNELEMDDNEEMPDSLPSFVEDLLPPPSIEVPSIEIPMTDLPLVSQPKQTEQAEAPLKEVLMTDLGPASQLKPKEEFEFLDIDESVRSSLVQDFFLKLKKEHDGWEKRHGTLLSKAQLEHAAQELEHDAAKAADDNNPDPETMLILLSDQQVYEGVRVRHLKLYEEDPLQFLKKIAKKQFGKIFAMDCPNPRFSLPFPRDRSPLPEESAPKRACTEALWNHQRDAEHVWAVTV